MIKPSSASPASLVAPRTAASVDSAPRAGGREGENGAFADAMGAQGPRDDADARRDRKSAVDEGGQSAESSGPTASSTDTASLPSTTPIASTDPGVDPMLGLCTTPPGEMGPDASLLTATAHGGAVPPTAPPPDLAATEPGAAGDARALLEGELQKRLALGGAAMASLAAAGTGTIETPSTLESVVAEAGGPVGVNANGAAGETRTADRTGAVPTAPAAGRPPELRAPLGSTAWADELGARVTWIVDRGEQVASLRLSPENLGPVEVRIAVREGETSVWFGATHADTRAALEQSLPRLREMLGASGLSLADAGVFSHTPRDPQRGFTAAALARAAQESGADPTGGIVMQVSRRGLVDLYA